MSSSIVTTSWRPSVVNKSAKRSIDTSGRDTALATVLGAVGILAIFLIGILIWYFHREPKPGRQSGRVDISGHQNFPVDVEKGLPERPFSMVAPSVTSTVVSTGTRAIFVVPPTPTMPVHVTTRQRVNSIARPFSMSEEISMASPIRTNYIRASDDAVMRTTSTTNAQIPFIRVPINPSLSNAAGPRFVIHNLTKDDISPTNSSSVSEVDGSSPVPVELEGRPVSSTSRFRSKSVTKHRPSDLIISRHATSQVHGKGKTTPNVPASPSQNEWSAGPIATPSTSRQTHMPGISIPPFVEINFSPGVGLFHNHNSGLK